MPEQSPEIPVEVVSTKGSGSDGRVPPVMGSGGDPGSWSGVNLPVIPFHPAAAGLMILVDGLWGIPEFAVVAWPFTVTGCFLSVLIPSYWIQRKFHRDRPGMAFLKAAFLAVLAAVPLPVMGTTVGLALLAWFGIKSPRR